MKQPHVAAALIAASAASAAASRRSQARLPPALSRRAPSASMLRKLGGAALLGALAYTTHDAAADSAMYMRAKR